VFYFFQFIFLNQQLQINIYFLYYLNIKNKNPVKNSEFRMIFQFSCYIRMVLNNNNKEFINYFKILKLVFFKK
jgi:hypothetical protein